MAVQEAFYIWLASEVVAPNASAAAIERLKPGWQRRLAKAAIRESRVRVSRRRLRTWLSAHWPQLVRSRAEDVSSVVESMEELVSSDWRQRGMSEEDIAGKTQRLLDQVFALFLSNLDQGLANAVADHRRSWQFNTLDAGQKEIRSILEDTSQFDDHLERLPPPAARVLQEAFEAAPVQTARLASYLGTQSVGPKELIRELWSKPPAWLTEGSYQIRLAAAEYAAAHVVPDLAADIFEALAEEAAPDRRRWLARAGLAAINAGDEQRARRLLEAAQELGEEPHPFVEFAAALTTSDPVRILEASDPLVLEGDQDVAMATIAKARALALTDRVNEAIELLNVLNERQPAVTSASVLNARMLLGRASRGSSQNRFEDLTRALELSLRARDQRRLWRGDSSEATAVAVEVAFALGDGNAVLRIGLPAPAGEALDAEAKAPYVVSTVALAAISLNRVDLAADLVDRIQVGFQKSLVQGWLSEHSGDIDEARSHYLDAFESAGPGEKHQVQAALAMIGDWPIPGFEEVAEEDPVRADELAAMSESARGLHEDAIRRLRPHIHASRTSAMLAAEVHVEAGDVEAAVDVLERARAQFQDPSFLARAAFLLYPVDLSRTMDVASRGLAELPEGSADRPPLLRLLIQCAADSGDWVVVENHARTAMASGDKSPTTRWALVMALYNQGHFERSWHTLSENGGLAPEDEIQARLWIDLNRRYSPNEETVLEILQLAESYQESEQLVGEALMAIYTMSNAIDLSGQTVDRLHAVTFDFTDRFPESSILSLVRADSPEQLIDQMREVLEPGSEQFAELVRRVWLGELPYGFLSAFVGRPYSEALVRRAAGCLPAQVEAQEEDEIGAVLAALNTRIVVDASALNVLSYIQQHWPTVRSQFSAVLVPRESVLDAVAGRESLSLRSTMTIGWDPSAGAPRLSEITEDEARVLAERASWIAGEMLTLDVIDGIEWERFSDLADERNSPWLAPLELALQEGLSIYTDDSATRSLAISMGVTTFGTVSLLKALNRIGELSDKELEELLVDLASGFVVDLSLPDSAMFQLAEVDGWQPGAASFLTARPAFWKDPRSALDRFLVLYRNSAQIAPEASASWLYSASSGLAYAIRSDVAASAVGELLALATAAVGLWDPAGFERSVGAAREGLRVVHGGDPLPRALEMIHKQLVEVLDHPQASQALLGLTGNLQEPDRLLALRLILRNDDI